ncbi:hypothetical protein PHLCEN_2v11255 [Hermanssonia centrifuga]|uniref:Cation/H+ exchanger transmembrane domain-containing protein n=1 Tax=Hermanssonia centrifuga TaxID=98765 RepID=A0A2R6NKW6_9APHY|nr:hypothetical protein PHLCEN_2v11255 [Hermanssonia centrifuga]
MPVLRTQFRGDEQDQVDDGWTEEHSEAVKVTLMILFVSAISSIAYYTGSSVLFGAYLAGLTLPYMSRPTTEIGATPHSGANYEEQLQALSFEETYKRIITPLQQYILAPLFFASIGYAIPFLSLWKPSILWRGVVYAALMCLAKLAVGFPIAIWTVFPPRDGLVKKSNNGFFDSWIHMLRLRRKSSDDARHLPNPDTETATGVVNSDTLDSGHPLDGTSPPPSQTRYAGLRAAFPSSAFMGIAMVARGEIGLLIAQIARIDSGSSSANNRGLLGDEAFLVCIWAILLCTLIGPVGLGFVIRRWGKAVHQGTWR